MIFSRFQVFNLYGKKNIDLRINDNKLILVAGNGEGKTTILSIIFYFVTKQWFQLSKFQFEKIVATIDDKDYFFSNKLDLSTTFAEENVVVELVKKYPLYTKFIEEVLVKNNLLDLQQNVHLVSSLEEVSDVPRGLILKMVDFLIENQLKMQEMGFHFKTLYLPTYRRIERGFQELFSDLDERTENYIIARYPNLKPIRNEKHEMENGSFDDVSKEVTNEPLENNLKNIFTNIWKEKDLDSWKKHHDSHYIELVEFGMDDVEYKVAFFLKSKDRQENDKISKLIHICNKYFAPKKNLEVEVGTDKLRVKLLDNSFTTLSNLSSGEKQIVSIFCHLILSKDAPLLIIDEPEISLSLKWQEQFLSDIQSCSNIGFLVATHSPFIVTDKLKNYTAGLNEFIS